MLYLLNLPPNHSRMNTKTASLFFGILFIAVGLLGFIPNPVIGDSEKAIFHADTLHNMVHIVSGVLFLFFALAAPASAPAFLKIFGVVYLLLGITGIAHFAMDGMGRILGILHVNGADNLLHIGLGVAIFVAGLLPKEGSELK